MKIKLIVLLWCFIFSSAIVAQNKITGISTYLPTLDTIRLTQAELDYLLKKSYVVCCKVDVFDDTTMVKTIQIECFDTTFVFRGAYMESCTSPKQMEIKDFLKSRLKCEFVAVDKGGFYENYQLDAFGRKYFEGLLNKTALICEDTYK